MEETGRPDGQPALVADATGAASVSAHAGDGQAYWGAAKLIEYHTATCECGWSAIPIHKYRSTIGHFEARIAKLEADISSYEKTMEAIAATSDGARIAELVEALGAAVATLRTASCQLTEDHKLVLGGKPWGGSAIESAERALAKVGCEG